MVTDYQQIFESVCFQTFGYDVEVHEFQIVSAGILNTGAKLITDEGPLFVKLNESEDVSFFETEARDLERLSPYIQCPKVMGYGHQAGFNYLLLDFISENIAQKKHWEEAGAMLASVHRITFDRFGLDRSNYLASIPQNNSWKSNGVDFLSQNRILAQAGVCLLNEEISLALFKEIEALCGRLTNIVPEEIPALLHGDLWSGNLLFDEQGQPFYVDPACYYGLRESELAFTFLFGGFDPVFYESYLEHFPLLPGFNERVAIYHLHPLLVHVHLFGEAYIPGIQRIVKRFS